MTILHFGALPARRSGNAKGDSRRIIFFAGKAASPGRDRVLVSEWPIQRLGPSRRRKISFNHGAKSKAFSIAILEPRKIWVRPSPLARNQRGQR
jgi:hypothetical protein